MHSIFESREREFNLKIKERVWSGNWYSWREWLLFFFFYRKRLTLHIVCFRCVVWWMINWICRCAWGVSCICVKSMSKHKSELIMKSNTSNLSFLVCLCDKFSSLQISTSAREGSAHKDVWTPSGPTTAPASLGIVWAPTRPLAQVHYDL